MLKALRQPAWYYAGSRNSNRALWSPWIKETSEIVEDEAVNYRRGQRTLYRKLQKTAEDTLKFLRKPFLKKWHWGKKSKSNQYDDNTAAFMRSGKEHSKLMD